MDWRGLHFLTWPTTHTPSNPLESNKLLNLWLDKFKELAAFLPLLINPVKTIIYYKLPILFKQLYTQKTTINWWTMSTKYISMYNIAHYIILQYNKGVSTVIILVLGGRKYDTFRNINIINNNKQFKHVFFMWSVL